MNEMAQRVARNWMQQTSDPHLRKVGPTRFQVQQLRLPVSDARFDAAMGMAARDMGGRYIPATGTIKLPKVSYPGDKTFPTEIQVLYRKFPCGAVIPNVRDDDPVSGLPCVSFDIIPNTPGDPRRSKIYQSFMSEAASSKVMFGKFLGWLKIVSKAINRYVKSLEQGREVPFARVARDEMLVEQVVRKWFTAQMR
jgi:hypothetical protein